MFCAGKVGSPRLLLQFFRIQGGMVLHAFVSAAQAAGFAPVPDGNPRTQLAGRGGNLPEKPAATGPKAESLFLSIEEEQQVRRCLSEENFQAFRQDQVRFYGKLLSIFGLPVGQLLIPAVWQSGPQHDDGA
jgi:hypothetical protein